MTQNFQVSNIAFGNHLFSNSSKTYKTASSIIYSPSLLSPLLDDVNKLKVVSHSNYPDVLTFPHLSLNLKIEKSTQTPSNYHPIDNVLPKQQKIVSVPQGQPKDKNDHNNFSVRKNYPINLKKKGSLKTTLVINFFFLLTH